MREGSREPQQLHKKGKQVCVQFGSCNGGWNCWLERRKSRRGWCGYFPSPLSHLTWHYEGGDLMIWGWQARVCPCYGLFDFSTNGRLRSKKEMMLWSGNSSFSWHSPWKGMGKRSWLQWLSCKLATWWTWFSSSILRVEQIIRDGYILYVHWVLLFDLLLREVGDSTFWKLKH